MLHIKKATALSLVLALSICLCACGTPAASTPNSSGASVSAGSQSGEYNLADATYVLKAGHVLAEKLYNQPTTTFTPLETVQTGACTYKIFVYKSADISYNESAML